MEQKNDLLQVQKWGKITPHFNLRQTTKDEPTIVYCVYRFAGRQWKITTGVKVIPSQWSVKEQMAIVSNQQRQRDNRNNKIANKVLNDIQTRFVECVERTEDADQLERLVIELTKEIYPETARKHVTKPVNFRYTGNETTDEMKPKAQPMIFTLKKVNDWKTKTEQRNPKALNVAINMFSTFIKEKGIEDVEDNMNRETYNEFVAWMRENGYAINTLRNAAKGIRTLFNNVNEMENRTENRIPVETMKTPKDNRNNEDKHASKPPLEDSELEALWNMRGLTEKETECRDLFIAQTCSGQRVSDLYKVISTPVDSTLTVDGMEFVKIYQKKGEKNGATAIIPISQKLAAIRARYADGFKFYNVAKEAGQTKYSLDICKLARLAGLNRTITYRTEQGETETKPLYELLTSHNARHTFSTRMAAAGMETRVIGFVTGHSTGKDVLTSVYIHNESQEKAKQIQREYIRKAEVRESFIFSPVETTQTTPTPNQQPTQSQSQNPTETNMLLNRVESLTIEKYEEKRARQQAETELNQAKQNPVEWAMSQFDRLVIDEDFPEPTDEDREQWERIADEYERERKSR